ncbi:sigma-70 family RNA polymerase sigma factor [Nocardioides sp. C4-1]|uniref:RNA polymerase sigma factor n=1 Tax=Nocardioides sp. C4-1 TaxID=3151851 RepID=UPI0032634703
MTYEEFVVAEQQRLLGLAHALTGNPHDAWDLTQETLVRVAERWRRIDDARPYARQVMVRLNVDRIRRRRRERPVDETPDAAVEPVLVGDVDPWLVEALATLSPQQRTALALRFVEDLDTRTIAERLGCSEGTARSHLSRGTERLRHHARQREQEPNR